MDETGSKAGGRRDTADECRDRSVTARILIVDDS